MKDTKVIVEGALTTVIFIALLLICVYIPPITIVGMFFLPLPLIYYTAKRGFRSGVIAFLTSLLLAILFTHIVTAVSVLIFLAVGLFMGWAIFSRKSAFAILGIGSLIAIICLIILYGVLVTFFKLNPTDIMINQASDLSKMAEQMGSSAAKQQWSNYRDMLKLLPTLLPMIFTVGGILFTLICELVSAPILRRLGIDFPKWPPFRDWIMPRSLIWYYLISLGLLFFGGLDTNGTLFMVVLNVFELLEMAMVLQGITFIFFYCHTKGLRLTIPVLISIIGSIIPITLYIIRILGIIDLGMGLRARIRKQ